MIISVHLIISGRVQGVWYRASTKQRAEQLGITGWVKNTHDGHVEAVFEGEEEIVQNMIKWCWKGSPHAIVNDVKIISQKTNNIFENFSIKY